MSGILTPYRVLDLTNERGLLCGQILGDLGADVVQIEPPGGSSARRLGPFFADEPGPDRSLYWWAYNRNNPAAGADRWAAIVCRSDEEWRALCGLIGRDDLASDPRLRSASGRQQHREEIDRAIGEWTRGREAAEIERLAQARGIPAHQLQTSRQCFDDRQLRHRRHFVELEHPVYGTTIVEGPRVGLSRTPGRATRAAPTLGRDNQYVLSEILGYDGQRITQLVVSGVMG